MGPRVIAVAILCAAAVARGDATPPVDAAWANAPDGVDLCAPGGPLSGKEYPAATRAFEQALKTYEREDYAAAAPALYAILVGAAGDAAESRVRAAFFLAKTLFNLKLYLPSLSCFRAPLGDPSARHHARSIQWLVALAAHLPPESGVGAQLLALDPATLGAPAPMRDEALYLAGLVRWRAGRTDEALAVLARVEDGDGFAPKAVATELMVLAAGAPIDREARIVRRARERAELEKRERPEPEWQLATAAIAAARCDYRAATKRLAAWRAAAAREVTGDGYTPELAREQAILDGLAEPWRGSRLGDALRADLAARRRKLPQRAAEGAAQRRADHEAALRLAALIEAVTVEGAAGRSREAVRAEQRCVH